MQAGGGRLVEKLFSVVTAIGFLLLTTGVVAVFKFPLARASNPTLTLTLQSPVVAGGLATVAGTGYDASSVVTFTLDGAALTTNPATVTTNGSGVIPNNVSFTIPSLSISSHTVQASTSATAVVQATFVIATPAIALTPTNSSSAPAAVGSTMLAILTGFEASSLTTLLFDNASVATGTTSTTGALDLTFVVPDINNTGTHTIRASNSAFAVATINAFIATPTITLNPAAAVPGQPVTVTGTNFKAGAAVTFSLNGETLDTSAAVTASGGGGFAAVFTVPDLIQGVATVKAQSYANLYAVATLTVATPALTLLPTTAVPGQTVNVTGTNFKASSAISFYMNGSSFTTNDSSVITNDQGFFTTTFVMPASSNVNQIFKAQSYANYFATSTITVSTPTLTLSPTSGPDGLVVHAIGTGFDANTTVSFYANTVALNQSAATNAVGAFTTTITMPGGIPSGAQTIRAVTANSTTAATATYTVTAAAVTVSPTTGTAGTRVFVSGTNLDPNAIVSFKWNGQALTMTEGTITTNSAGSFGANFTIPDSYVIGGNQIEVSTSQTNTVLTSFIATANTMTLSAASGPPGANITVTGAGFGGNTKVKLTWDDGTSLKTTPSSIITTPLGGFYGMIDIPSKAVRGTHYITAQAGTNFINSTVFTVTTPSLTLSTTSSQPGSKITVVGSSFTPKATVTLDWDNSVVLTTSPVTVVADASGAFVAVVTIPTGSTTGTHTLGAKTSDSVIATNSFTVTTGAMTLSRSSGVSRQVIQLGGTNFDTSAPVTLLWDEEATDVVDITTDGIGGFNSTFSIPLSGPGDHTLRAYTSKFSTASMTFSVDTPTVDFSPKDARAGSKIVVRGSGFTANEEVTITINGKTVKTDPETVTTDANGAFVATVVTSIALNGSTQVGASTSGSNAAAQDILVKGISMVRGARAVGILTLLELFIVLSYIGFLRLRRRMLPIP